MKEIRENILRMHVINQIGFKAHPQRLYRATYTQGTSNQTKLSISMPKLNYYEQEDQLKYTNLKVLLIPSNKQITRQDDPQTLDQNKIKTYINASDCYLSETGITPELFDTQEKECHLITFNKRIPNGTYKAILLQPAGTSYKLFEEFPGTIQSTSEITITGIQPDLTDDTTITPKTINIQTLKLETLQNGKITITIDSDYFTGKTFSSSDGKRKIRRWIKIMKGTETILPKTEISTTYDDHGNTITEVKEDYDTNKITITIPEYYLTGSTNKPSQKPQLPEGEYKIAIYQTNTATTPLTQKPIHLIQMPFNLTFYHHDHLGTTRYITNENGEILHTTDTLAYGEELTAPYENDKDEVLNTITYTGHEKDYETGLTYMLARYYSQGYGRFLSPDPGYDYDQLDPMSWNLYSYVRGNPVNRIDPDGRLGLSPEEERKLLEKKARIKARLQYEINAGKLHPENWPKMQPDGRTAPELKDTKTVEREKKEQEGWKKAGEEAEKKTKVKRLNTVIQTADNVAEKTAVVATASLARPTTWPVVPPLLTASTYASIVSVAAKKWKASLTGDPKDRRDAFISSLWLIGSATINKVVDKSLLPQEYKNLINSFVSDASNEGTSSNQ